MNATTPTNRKPTTQEFYAALDICSAYTRAHPRKKSTARRHARIEREIQKRKVLAAECEKVSQALYEQLLGVLPGEYHDILGSYVMMEMAPNVISKDTYRLFDSSLKRAKKLLAAKKPNTRG